VLRKEDNVREAVLLFSVLILLLEKKFLFECWLLLAVYILKHLLFGVVKEVL